LQGRLDAVEATVAAYQRELAELRQKLAEGATHSPVPKERGKTVRRASVPAKKTALARKPR
jgi:hypothetical protein